MAANRGHGPRRQAWVYPYEQIVHQPIDVIFPGLLPETGSLQIMIAIAPVSVEIDHLSSKVACQPARSSSMVPKAISRRDGIQAGDVSRH